MIKLSSPYRQAVKDVFSDPLVTDPVKMLSGMVWVAIYDNNKSNTDFRILRRIRDRAYFKKGGSLI